MSNLTDILTGRIDLKRLTNLLLAPTALSASMSFDRNPDRTSRLEITIDGASITNGLVSVTGIGSGVLEEYVLQDRTLPQKWAFRIVNGVINAQEVEDVASSEPVVPDNLDSTKYWKIFIDNGIIGAEATSEVVGLTQTNDPIIEQIQFAEDGIQVGTSDFLTMSGLTISGIDGGTITVRAIDELGQPINKEIVAESNMPIRWYTQNGHIRMMDQGQEKIAQYKMMAGPLKDVQENDIVYALSGVFGLTIGEVSFSEKIYDFAGLTHHTEAEVMEL